MRNTSGQNDTRLVENALVNALPMDSLKPPILLPTTVPNQEVIFHIGSRKTASTWLQTRVFPKLKHVQYLEPRGKWAKEFFWLGDETTPPASTKPFLVSWENLEGIASMGSRDFETCMDTLSKTSGAKILYLFRSQKGRAISGFQETLRSGWHHNFTQWISPEFSLLGHSSSVLDAFDYWRRFQILEERFPGRFAMIPMEALFAGDTKALEQLTKVLGADFVDVWETERHVHVNEAMTLGWYRFFRVFNFVLRKIGIGIGGGDPRGTGEPYIRSIFRKLSRKGTKRGRRKLKVKLQKEAERVDWSRYAEGNRKLSEALGMDLAAYGYES